MNVDNQIDLGIEDVIDTYRINFKNEKQKAALFLFKNMSIHKGINYRWLNNENEIVSFSELNYSDIEVAVAAFNKLKDTVHLHPQVYEAMDTDELNGKLFYKNIELAFEEWRGNSWSQNYDFETFCEYILPYRSLVEPLEDWREEYRFIFKSGLAEVSGSNDPVEVISKVILNLKDYRFLANRPDPIPILSPKQLLFRRAGACPDLSNLALLAGRSIGLAVTFDFTPHYAASSNRHFWNSIIDQNGNSIPFNGNSYGNTDGLPYAYHPQKEKRVAKVFRKTFSIQTESVGFRYENLIPSSSFLTSKNIIDVTKEYVSTGEIVVNTLPNLNYNTGFINVYNFGKWRNVDWALKEQQYYVFDDLGKEIVYLPSVYDGDKMHYYHYPILLSNEGKSQVLKPAYNDSFNFCFDLNNSKYNPFGKEHNSVDIQNDEIYKLMVWDKEWKVVSTSVAFSKKLLFEKTPDNGLFLVLSETRNGYERIFTINKTTNQITWY
ncbi:hypothetical protein [Flavicella sp.]|uniref:hypothetical protein n=1 Tax=Flavicella sp. TaxID=2957742 RepID=UPI00261414DA|nr:hypothetical protein [Flavicella sp.]MDG1805931.1 hypothetical protein [Flavicella sp.]